MALLQDLIAQIADPVLRERILAETNKLLKRKKFGLVFEEHLPECAPLYEVPVRAGLTAALKAGPVSDLYTVLRVDGETALCERRENRERKTFQVDDLVVAASFGEPIYPYLKRLDAVCNAPDSDLWHTLIEAENYHALQLLEYLYAGKVDCIYIDPPYNTGARDWKYNNDYVDASDAYRHSKWLSMMERRLNIAKRLLNPQDSVLIVTIDEKEYLHLGCLLEDMFSDATIQMVTSVINPKGSVKDGLLTRCDEYIYFVIIGKARLFGCDTDFLFPTVKETVRWPSLKRTGTNSMRRDRPNLFYPLFYSKKTRKFVKTGEVLDIKIDRSSVSVPDEFVAVWPIDTGGNERIWQLGPETLNEISKSGFVNFGLLKNNSASPYYVSAGIRQQIEINEISIVGYDENGIAILEYSSGIKRTTPKTTWNLTSHSASEHGTNLLNMFFSEKRFSFPKSLYAVRDAILISNAFKPDALILDFFAGSGTTLHAVNLLNAEDGGRRRCILVTNNEVSDDEAKALKKRGHKPGDEEWEKLGIARYVTWPRTVCGILGRDVNGAPLKGVYLGSDRPMADGFRANAAFFKLGFLDKTLVALGEQFRELLPLLWLKAGAVGPCPELATDEPPDMLILPENRFAVLIDERSWPEFSARLAERPEIRTVFLVTDSAASFKRMAKGLENRTTYQLYKDYLDNFRINTGRRA